MGVKKWGWLGFPLLVGVGIVVSYGWLVAGPDQIWRKLRMNGEEVKVAEVEVAKLKSKLDKLNWMDVAGQREMLNRLEKVVPGQIQFMLLIGGVNQAASESGLRLEKYKVGKSETRQVLEVSLQTGDVGKLIDWINNMEKQLPLVRIVRISYREGRAEVVVEQMWKEFGITGAKPEDELPETGERVKDILSKLGEFREVTSSGQTRDVGGVNPNPF